MEAIFVQCGESIDYTPSSAVVAGKVVQMGGFIGVTKAPIAASIMGALAIAGIFAFAKSGSAGPTFEKGDPIHFTVATGLASRAGGSGTIFLGNCTEAAGASDTTVKGKLAPHNLPAWLVGKKWEDVDISGGSKTLDVEDVGKVMNVTVGHATNVVTLPATGAQFRSFAIRCGASGQRIAVSPNASDKIFGPDIPGVDDTDMILAAATSQMGDYLAIGAAGVDGYAIDGRQGTFT